MALQPEIKETGPGAETRKVPFLYPTNSREMPRHRRRPLPLSWTLRRGPAPRKKEGLGPIAKVTFPNNVQRVKGRDDLPVSLLAFNEGRGLLNFSSRHPILS